MTQLTEQTDSRIVSEQSPLTGGRELWLVVGISILVLLPCVWHGRIEAGDLGSHMYNAWLSQLIGRGQAPGLQIVPQWSNVLADVALAGLGNALGFAAAEKIVVGLSVLIFFWGAFALIAAATQRAPWFLVPGLAMIAYGYTFQMGFINYYLSLGLAFWVIALLWRGRAAHWIMGLILAGLVLSAHLMGFMWLVGAAAYIKVAERLSKGRWCLPILSLVTILTAHFYVAHLYRTFNFVGWHVYHLLGFDQLVLYSHRYRALAMVMLVLTILIARQDAIRRWRSSEFWRMVRTPLELWVMAVCATAMLWAGIMIPKYATSFTYVAARFTSVTAVLGFCVLGCMRPRRWHAVCLGICAAVFFASMYRDTGRLYKMEVQAERLVNGLPPGTRMVQTILMPKGSRIDAVHILDRACIGRCFAYANYEPASGQFRIRAKPGNAFVATSLENVEAMQRGTYIVRPEDLPFAEIYQCDQRDLSKLCVRDLAAGEMNGQQGRR
jgi:hypothetical protein